MTVAAIYLAYDPDDVKPGWIALIIVLLLALATFLLWRSMNTQLGRIKVPKKGEVPHSTDDTAPDAQAEATPTDEDGQQGGDRPSQG